jgi:hypothetical protein
MVDGLTDYVITTYAEFEMRRRGLSRETVHQVVTTPEQRIDSRPGRVILQSRVAYGAGEIYLVRVVVDIDRRPAEVVTAYRTSRIAKYWRAIG